PRLQLGPRRSQLRVELRQRVAAGTDRGGEISLELASPSVQNAARRLAVRVGKTAESDEWIERRLLLGPRLGERVEITTRALLFHGAHRLVELARGLLQDVERLLN